ncbi:hypothetical protein GCM10010522_20520 [Kribbella solani]
MRHSPTGAGCRVRRLLGPQFLVVCEVGEWCRFGAGQGKAGAFRVDQVWKVLAGRPVWAWTVVVIRSDAGRF